MCVCNEFTLGTETQLFRKATNPVLGRSRRGLFLGCPVEARVSLGHASSPLLALLTTVHEQHSQLGVSAFGSKDQQERWGSEGRGGTVRTWHGQMFNQEILKPPTGSFFSGISEKEVWPLS